jgi:hypothetical protein
MILYRILYISDLRHKSTIESVVAKNIRFMLFELESGLFGPDLSCCQADFLNLILQLQYGGIERHSSKDKVVRQDFYVNRYVVKHASGELHSRASIASLRAILHLILDLLQQRRY